jgi:hypothetical protein
VEEEKKNSIITFLVRIAVLFRSPAVLLPVVVGLLCLGIVGFEIYQAWRDAGVLDWHNILFGSFGVVAAVMVIMIYRKAADNFSGS